uniref:Dehydrogenase/reductase SDR family member 1 n=1 Tax=Panagrellus redivivus TaxID=6233 RepID=A0A7E4W5A0_PANRE
MSVLAGKVALVTGASRGIGRGIALQLGSAGAKVYITGRKPEASDAAIEAGLPSLDKTAKDIESRGGKAVIVYTDHSNSSEIKALFNQIADENDGTLDILVNNAYAGADFLMKNSDKRFFELEPEVWDVCNNVGLRNHYFCSVYATRLMVARNPPSGIIVNISSAGGLKFFLNVAYGVGKAALDRMSVDMAVELQKLGITSIALWPGAVKTELSTMRMAAGAMKQSQHDEVTPEQLKAILAGGESTEFAGKAIVALAADPKVHKLNGRIFMTGDVADRYGFVDVDGKRILSARSLKFLLQNGLVPIPGAKFFSYFVPAFVKIPGWFLSAFVSAL